MVYSVFKSLMALVESRVEDKADPLIKDLRVLEAWVHDKILGAHTWEQGAI